MNNEQNPKYQMIMGLTKNIQISIPTFNVVILDNSELGEIKIDNLVVFFGTFNDIICYLNGVMIGLKY